MEVCISISSDLPTNQAGFTAKALAIESITGSLIFVILPFSYRCIVDLATPIFLATSSSVYFLKVRALCILFPISILFIKKLLLMLVLYIKLLHSAIYKIKK